MRFIPGNIFLPILIVLLLTSVLAGVGIGAVSISPLQALGILGHAIGIDSKIQYEQSQEAVLLSIRLPRVLLAVCTGAALAISGAAMQGLFRNPLADPGLIGISSGASMAAVFFIVSGVKQLIGLSDALGIYALSAVTFLGALTTTIIVYRLSQVSGRTVISMMLLAGIGVNALTSAITGMFTYSANDAELRSIVFWTLGSLGGATWTNVLGILPFTILPILVMPGMSKSLNAFALGENNALHLGVDIQKVKRSIIILSALCVGASVAVTGVIVFLGLVVPHIIRMLSGPDHRYLLPFSALAGAILLINADIVSRTAFAPSEIPIGIITSIIGAPFFLYILLKERKTNRLL